MGWKKKGMPTCKHSRWFAIAGEVYCMDCEKIIWKEFRGQGFCEWVDPFEYEKWVQIDRFVITEDASTADVDKLIKFLHERHIKQLFYA